MADSQDLQLQFTDQQLNQLKALLQARGLLDADGVTVVNTLIEFGANPPVGLFAPIYNYIYSIIQNSSTVDPSTKYWFSQAANINADNRDDPADNYIRGVTQYGLEFRGSIPAQTQGQIDAGLQETSNLIGQQVIQDVLNNNGMPVFGEMITGDISAAIGNSALGNFQQDAGGWGGSFYFWNAPLHFQQPDQITVGNAILNGGVPESPKASLDEFYFANSNATADFAITEIKAAAPIVFPLLPGPIAGLALATMLKFFPQ